MDCEHDREPGAGPLCLTVQRTSQHAAALTPTSHTIRHEYLAGLYPRLTHRTDDRLKENARLEQTSLSLVIYGDQVLRGLAHDEDPSVFFDWADQAMYAAKGNGSCLVTVAHV